MKRILLFAVAAGISLGSASPSTPSLLHYDLSGVRDWDPYCPANGSAGCDMVTAVAARMPDPSAQETQNLFMGDDSTLATDGQPGSAGSEMVEPSALPASPPAAPSPPPPPPDNGVRVVISIPQQKAYVFDDGVLVATSRVSTGRRGYETPAGTFPILQKKVHHHSNLYDNAPMPYMQRLTNGGVALHAGSLPGYPASHGCIRLPWSFAKKLYNMTRIATPVTITHESPSSNEEALSLS